MSDVQSGYVAFRPRARLLKLIGEELISDEVVALTELVKNAHDADASRVRISFRNVQSEKGEIEIVDDGFGMDLDTLLGGWMEPAGSTKASADARVTRKGRRVLGEKGVGRFAADKLGSRLELISLRAGTNGEVRAVFDWDRFDADGEMLSDVKSRWEIRPATVVKGNGTILRIGGLRQAWNERMFRRLCTRLSRLRPPSSGRGFRIDIESDDFPDYAGELPSGFLDKAPYRIDAEFDGQGTLRTNAGDEKLTIPLGATLGELDCGPVRIRLHAFDLETDAIARIGPRHEVRAWLREWSGVSVYRDGFRVWPYGEVSDDWLRLDQRRVNNPVVRLSNNQVVGVIEITRDGNPLLFDQTNREGLMNNKALADLRRVIDHVFQLLEAQRQRIRHPESDRRPSRRERPRVELPVADAIENLASLAQGRTAVQMRRLAQEARDTLERKELERSRLIEGYNDLAAAGQVATSIADAASASIEQARAALARMRARVRHPEMSRDADVVSRELDHLASHVSSLGGVSTGGSHRRRTMDAGAEAQRFGSMLAPVVKERGIRMDIDLDGELLRVDMNPHSFHRVLHILSSNALDWLGRTRDPRIVIELRDDGADLKVTFSDNGPGIPRDVAPRVFDPSFSLKEGGRGMGLTIARGLIEQNGGTIEVDTDGRRRGARLVITLPRKRSRATIGHR